MAVFTVKTPENCAEAVQNSHKLRFMVCSYCLTTFIIFGLLIEAADIAVPWQVSTWPISLSLKHMREEAYVKFSLIVFSSCY